MPTQKPADPETLARFERALRAALNTPPEHPRKRKARATQKTKGRRAPKA